MTIHGSGKQASGCLCLCLGSPMRALSRACDSACDLYVRGMSGCASRIPTGAFAGGAPGFVSSATAAHLWMNSDYAGDLIRAAKAKQRRVATPEPADDAAAKKGRLGLVAPAIVPAARRKGPAMGTIAEDEPCDFEACTVTVRLPELRRRAAAVSLSPSRLGTRPFAARA